MRKVRSIQGMLGWIWCGKTCSRCHQAPLGRSRPEITGLTLFVQRQGKETETLQSFRSPCCSSRQVLLYFKPYNRTKKKPSLYFGSLVSTCRGGVGRENKQFCRKTLPINLKTGQMLICSEQSTETAREGMTHTGNIWEESACREKTKKKKKLKEGADEGATTGYNQARALRKATEWKYTNIYREWAALLIQNMFLHTNTVLISRL